MWGLGTYFFFFFFFFPRNVCSVLGVSIMKHKGQNIHFPAVCICDDFSLVLSALFDAVVCLRSLERGDCPRYQVFS